MKPPKENTNEKWPWYAAKYEMAEFIVSRLSYYKDNYNENGHSLPVWILDDSEKKESYSIQDEFELKIRWN